jgi:hypothetical protein
MKYITSKATLTLSIVLLILYSLSTIAAADTLPQSYQWSSQWITNDQRIYTFEQTGSNITATINTINGWKFTGAISGNSITGTWSDPPYTPNNHTGEEVFTMSDDGKSLSGKWKYGHNANSTWFNFTGIRSSEYQNNLQISLTANVLTGAVKLTWNSDPSVIIRGYNIYRGTSTGKEEFDPVNDEIIPCNTRKTSVVYNSYLASKGVYYYTCKAVFQDNTTSSPSNEVAIYVNDASKNIILNIDNPYMTVNGESIEIDPGKGTKPTIVNNRALVPIRSIINVLGGRVKWNASDKKVTLKQGTSTIDMWIDKTDVLINGTPKQLDVSPQIVNNRTMLPLRFITENLGCSVYWDGTLKNITLTR